MLRALIRKQLLELFQTWVLDRKTGKARSKKGLILMILFSVLIFGGLGMAFYSMAGGLALAVLGHGVNWLYFALMGLLSMALGVFGSVFNTYASLYLPKDNESLLSLPIPPGTLLLARVAGVYVTSLLYSAWVWIPAVIAYWVLTPVNVCRILFPILLCFVTALFVTVLSCALGWVVALIASKAKGKSFLTVFLSLFVMAAYYVVYFRIINSLNEIIEHLASYGSFIQSRLHYVWLLGRAADGDAISMLLVCLVTALLAAICLFVLSRTFMRVAFSEERTEKKTQKEDNFRQLTPRKALLLREYKHFTSTPTWMLNGGLGLLILPILSVFLVTRHEAVRQMLVDMAARAPEVVSALPIFAFAIVGIAVSMNVISAASVSIEGKTLWILQTLPVDAWELLRAKESMNVQLNIYPALLSVLVLGTVLRLEILDIILIACAIWVYVWLMADLGLILDLKHPNLHWTNVAVPTKQNLSVIFQMFGGWLFCALLTLAGFFTCQIIGVPIVLACLTVLFFILWMLLRRWLKTKGAGILMTL